MRRSCPSCLVALLALFGAHQAGAAPAPTTPPPPPAAATVSSIGPLVKEHNFDLGGGMTGMRITAPADLVGVGGQTIAMVVWFYDANGEPIRSALPGWGDASNHLRVISGDTHPTTARAHADFTFPVPYGAFPRRREGRYQVEARALLVERVGNGRVVLARRSTTFFVE